ncbi:SMC-Scp complex subunit ScpB [candidate division WOR-3 bacterium]|nr:SMC-Scp complex subunit ScpB [candidate division WOR-3 bacterium]
MDQTPHQVAPTQNQTADAPLDIFEVQRVLESLLFAADAPLALDRLTVLLGVPPETVLRAVHNLNEQYTATGRVFRVSRVAQGFQLYSMPEYAEWVRRLYQHQFTHRLSRAALEVLAIVAYRQPVTRPDIEALRKVDCSGPLLTLLERRLVATAGRAHRPGNPFLYRTSREFLRYFGLESLDDLPRLDELSQFLPDTVPSEEPGPEYDTLAIEPKQSRNTEAE